LRAPYVILRIIFLPCICPSPGHARTFSKFQSVFRAAWIKICYSNLDGSDRYLFQGNISSFARR
jgi:hypothetical protein